MEQIEVTNVYRSTAVPASVSAQHLLDTSVDFHDEIFSSTPSKHTQRIYDLSLKEMEKGQISRFMTRNSWIGGLVEEIGGALSGFVFTRAASGGL